MATKPIKINILGDATHLNRTRASTKGKLGAFGKAAGLAGVAAVAGLGYAAIKLGQQSEAMSAAIIKGTGASGEALAGLEASALAVMTSVPESGEVVATALADVNTRFALTGDALEDTTETLLDFARLSGQDASEAVNGLKDSMGLFGVEASEASEVMGDFVRISQATGATVGELEAALGKQGGTLQALGFGLEESTALLGALAQEGVSVRKAGAGMEYFTDQMLAAGKDPREEWDKLQLSIQGAQTDTEAAALAAEAFGPSGLAMVGAIRGGSLELSGLMGEGVGVVEAQTAATATLGEKFAEISNKIEVLLMPVVEKLFDAFSNGLDILMPYIDKFIAILQEDGLMGVIDELSAKFEWFNTMRELIIDVIDTVQAAWRIFGDDISGFVVGMVDIIRERIQILISILDGVIDFIKAVFTGEWSDAWEAIKQIFAGVWNLLGSLIDQAWLTMKTSVGILLDGFKLLWDWGFLQDALMGALTGVGDMITGAFGAIVGGFWDLGKAIVGAIADGIMAAPGLLVDAIESLIPGGGLVGDIVGGIGGLFGGDDTPVSTGKFSSSVAAASSSPVINVSVATNADPYAIGEAVAWSTLTGGR